jgi:hypothetical protein
MTLTSFQLKRIEYLIKQAENGTFVCLGEGDAEIFRKLYKDSKREKEWQDAMDMIGEALKEERDESKA